MAFNRSLYVAAIFLTAFGSCPMPMSSAFAQNAPQEQLTAPAPALPSPDGLATPMLAGKSHLDDAPREQVPVPVAAVPAPAVSGAALIGKTHVEQAMSKCVKSVLMGALLGGLIGAAAGNTGQGLALGLGAGSLVCVIIMKVSSDKDKAQIRAAQLEALNSGNVQQANWVTQQGGNATTFVTPSQPGSVVMASGGSIECRSDNQCKLGDSWYPKQEVLAGRADPTAPAVVKVAFSSAHEIVCRRNTTRIQVDGNTTEEGSDVACLVGDTWVTGDQLKKSKIRESDVIV